jgi:nucleoside-diphosphate-sugar epimerase
MKMFSTTLRRPLRSGVSRSPSRSLGKPNRIIGPQCHSGKRQEWQHYGADLAWRALASDLLDAARTGRIKASIARSADFYGTDAKTSVPNLLVFQPLAQGMKAQWLANADVPHSFTYIPDAARALPLMDGAEDSWGQVWHLPTAAPPLTGHELVAAAARSLNVAPRLMVLRQWMLRLAGIFNGDIRESVEMLYQSALPYQFDSSKFERRFGVQPTPYTTGIAETAQFFKVR